MVTEDYVSFKIAKLLKEKGFDESVNRFYEISTEQPLLVRSEYCRNSYTTSYAAPTLQMAMKWLREEKNRLIEINYDKPLNFGKGYVYRYSIYDTNLYCIHEEDNFKSTEDAIEAALKYTLENLI